MAKPLEDERCAICDETTGRAGRGDDSLYIELDADCQYGERNQEVGPLCSECYERVEAANRIAYLEAQLARKDEMAELGRRVMETLPRLAVERGAEIALVVDVEGDWWVEADALTIGEATKFYHTPLAALEGLEKEGEDG